MSENNIFDWGLNVRPRSNPPGFEYGPDCFGPLAEHRRLDSIRGSLLNPKCQGPETVYSIVMDIGKPCHRERLIQQHLLFGAVTYAGGTLGREPVRSQGHIHKRSRYADGWSTPEVYQIWSGKAVIYMQERVQNDPGRCFAIYSDPGDIIVVPPGWGHATISADTDTPLTFGAWCDRDYGFEYEAVKSRNGLAWFPLVQSSGGLTWKANTAYKSTGLIEKRPSSYEQLGIIQGLSIYRQYEDDPDRFLFVPLPNLLEKKWKEFTP